MMPSSSAAADVAAHSRGDTTPCAQPSFEDVVHRYERSVTLSAYRITRDIDDARDVAQHVFMQLYLNAAQLADRRSIDRWLYVVTRNEALNVRRRRQRACAAEDSARDETPVPALEETVLRNERDRQVRATIALLPAGYRNILELRHLVAMPTVEIAQALGLPLKRVKRDVERAKTRLRIEMQRRGLADERPPI